MEEAGVQICSWFESYEVYKLRQVKAKSSVFPQLKKFPIRNNFPAAHGQRSSDKADCSPQAGIVDGANTANTSVLRATFCIDRQHPVAMVTGPSASRPDVALVNRSVSGQLRRTLLLGERANRQNRIRLRPI